MSGRSSHRFERHSARTTRRGTGFRQRPDIIELGVRPSARTTDAQLRIIDRASVSEARELVRACARAAGLDPLDVERMATAVSELAQNQIDHARKGLVECHGIARGAVSGIEIVAGDRGPGLVEPATAIAALLPGKGLGVGLAGCAGRWTSSTWTCGSASRRR
jgi:anti-sigma regulatory factor (Ser/Thr protein kinase)